MNFERILDHALGRRELLTKALFSRPESLHQFLPYEEYLPEHGVFLNKDGAMGAIYSVSLCEHETKTGEQIRDLLENLGRWFQFDERTVMQLLFEQASVLPSELPARPKSSANTNLSALDSVFERRVAKLEGALCRKLYLVIQRLPKGTKRSRESLRAFTEAIRHSHSTLNRELQEMLGELRGFRFELTRLELGTPLVLARLDGTDLVRVLRLWLNPKTWPSHEFSKWNPRASLSEQVLSSSLTLDHAGITREGTKSRVLTLKNAPAYAYPGAMTSFLSLPFPFRLGLNVSFPPSTQVKRHFAIKEFFLQNTPSAQARRQREDVEALQDQLVKGDRVVQMTFSILLDGDTDENLEFMSHRVMALFREKLDSEALVEDSIGAGLWLAFLPFNYHPIVDYTGQRAIRLLKSDLVHFCPVFDSFRGLPERQSYFLSREGNLAGFSLRSTGNSHHTAVIGDTGSAKSGLVISLLLAELRREPRPVVFVIDRKTSYSMVAQVVSSEMTTFDRGGRLPFSFFAGAYVEGTQLDEEKVAFLVHLLTTAMKLTSPHFEVESEHKTCITEAIRRAYANKAREKGVQYRGGSLVESGSSEASLTLTLDDVIAQLGALTGTSDFENYSQSVEEISKKLRPFYGDGIYAPFFRSTAPESSAKELDLYVYDLDSLTYDPVLQTLVTMGVVDEIRRKIKRQEVAKRGGFIVIEELGLLGRDNPVAKDFVIEAAETFRKLGFFLIGLTPNPKNYFDLAAGQAMWSVADHYLFLMTKPDNVEAIAAKSDLLDSAGVQIVKSLRTMPGKYSEFFYTHKTKSASGVYRNEPSPLELWLMPTHAPDHQAAQDALKRYPGEPNRALQWLTEKYPRGTTEGAQ